MDLGKSDSKKDASEVYKYFQVYHDIVLGGAAKKMTLILNQIKAAAPQFQTSLAEATRFFSEEPVGPVAARLTLSCPVCVMVTVIS